jgi:hypothetical protein
MVKTSNKQAGAKDEGKLKKQTHQMDVYGITYPVHLIRKDLKRCGFTRVSRLSAYMLAALCDAVGQHVLHGASTYAKHRRIGLADVSRAVHAMNIADWGVPGLMVVQGGNTRSVRFGQQELMDSKTAAARKRVAKAKAHNDAS